MAREADFRCVDVELRDIRDGEVLVENLWMSVDPYMRRSMDEAAKDLAPWPIGGALDGPCVGRVVKSLHPNFRPGQIVESMSGWQQHFISDGSPFVPYLSANNALAVRARAGIDARDWVGLLGIASYTAYAGMVCLNPVKSGGTVVISSGAGTVGSLACQIAKIRGHRVVSSAGSDDKVRGLLEGLVADAAFNYKTRPIGESLALACPDGIDLVLESASPEHLSACLPLMNELSTILIAGFVSIYSTGGRIDNLQNFEYVLDRYVTIKAYRFMDSLSAYDAFVTDMATWRSSGALQLKEVVFDGLENAPAAFCALLRGEAAGKVLVRLES